ncbi:MAG: OadG family protein [Bacteroidales bacterium]|nr:OadG family protein [Bacteroidales bacterium]
MLLAINWGNAVIIAVLGISVVFCILIVLIGVISLFGKIMAPKIKVPKKEPVTANTTGNEKAKPDHEEVHIAGIETAAIATALHLYFNDVHDKESSVITIKSTERRYSPWNSKIYGLNNNLVRK